MIGVTGGSGFIGSHFVDLLVKQDSEFRSLVRETQPTSESKSDRFERCLGDLLTPDSLDLFCRNLETIIHIAGIVKADKHGKVRDVIVEGTSNLLRKAEQHDVTNFVYVSSGAVDFLDGEYADAKREAEKIVRKSSLNWIIIRPTEIYGPRDRAGITGLISKILQWPFFPVIGDGNYQLQPLYVKDLCQGMFSVMTNVQACSRQILTLAGPEPIAFHDLVQVIGNCLGKKVKTVKIPVSMALGMAYILEKLPIVQLTDRKQIRRVMVSKHWDITSTQDLIPFQPRSFEDGIETVLKELSLK